MAYTRQNFSDGQVLSAVQLNHIEQGIVDLEYEFSMQRGVVYYCVEGDAPALYLKDADYSTVNDAYSGSKDVILYRYVQDSCLHYHCMGYISTNNRRYLVFQHNSGNSYERILISAGDSILWESGGSILQATVE